MHNSHLNHRQIHAVLFDLGNTLIFFDEDWNKVIPTFNLELANALLSQGYAINPDSFADELHKHMVDYYRQRGTEFLELTSQRALRELLAARGYTEVPAEHLQTALRRMFSISQNHWRAEVDAAPILQRLRQEGYRLGLISNASDDNDVQTLIDKANLRDYFEVILTSAAVGLRKPHPRIFQMALDALQVSPRQAVMVGDTLGADILGAHNLGMPAIWITRRADKEANRSHEETILPEERISSLSELPHLLRNWKQTSGSG